MADSTKTLIIAQNNVELQFEAPILVLDLLNANKVGIDQSCGGFGICTTCRFFIRKNPESFSVRNETEQERADERDFQPSERLACQTEIFNNAKIEIPI